MAEVGPSYALPRCQVNDPLLPAEQALMARGGRGSGGAVQTRPDFDSARLAGRLSCQCGWAHGKHLPYSIPTHSIPTPFLPDARVNRHHAQRGRCYAALVISASVPEPHLRSGRP